MAENESPSLAPQAEFLVPEQLESLLLNSQGKSLESEKPSSSAAPTMFPPLNLKDTEFEYEEPANDGYNWEIYLQNRVNGCLHTLTYYKCGDADCPALKRIERDLHGQITETKCKNDHNHDPPPPMPAVTPDQHVSESYDCEEEEEGPAMIWMDALESKKSRFE